jgi:hypothetical protein
VRRPLTFSRASWTNKAEHSAIYRTWGPARVAPQRPIPPATATPTGGPTDTDNDEGEPLLSKRPRKRARKSRWVHFLAQNSIFVHVLTYCRILCIFCFRHIVTCLWIFIYILHIENYFLGPLLANPGPCRLWTSRWRVTNSLWNTMTRLQ